jgi:hypothetical protein
MATNGQRATGGFCGVGNHTEGGGYRLFSGYLVRLLRKLRYPVAK